MLTHASQLSAQSFCYIVNNKIIGYAAVVEKEITHCNCNFVIGGLSCVGVHPDYQGRGIGTVIVSAASQYISSQPDIDFGIFTCNHSLVNFYEKAGNWIKSKCGKA